MGETGRAGQVSSAVARVGAVTLVLLGCAYAVADPMHAGLATFAVVGGVIVWQRPRNTIGWLLVMLGSLSGVTWLAPDNGPGSVVGDLIADLTSGFFGLVFFLVLLFPTGQLPSPRWRVPAGVGVAAIALIGVFDVLRPGDDTDVLAVKALAPAIDALYAPTAVVLVALGLTALVHAFMRMHRATGDEREQLRWFAFAAVVFPALMLVNGFAMGTSFQGLALFSAFTVGLATIAIAIGVAVMKYNLYAIDIVINKAIVFGALAAFITAVYASLVVGLGSVVSGARDEPNIYLSLIATTIVAVAFQPARARVQRFANRMVYGQRLSPYEAVASFAHRVAASFAFDHVLPEMAEAAAMGVGATRSRVRLLLPSGAEDVATWPVGESHDTFDRVVDVIHHGVTVGDIAIAKGRGEQVTRQDETLLRDLASEAGLAMSSLRLTEELKHRLVELQDSRRRLVAAQDEERRRMERDLHDGAQQQLVAIKIKLGLMRSILGDDAPEGVAALLDDVHSEASDTIGTLRDLARGLFPEVLVRDGLAAAVRAHAEKCTIPVVVEAGDLGRHPVEVEANVYFVVREALQNISKYAPGASAVVTFGRSEDELTFSIADDGPGFDLATMRAGSGTQNMRDRLEALGGAIHVDSSPGAGTTVSGTVPLAIDLRANAMEMAS